MQKHRNTVEFVVYGDYGLFSDPITRVGGEKCTLQIPTYEAIKGVLHSIYWKPTITWIVDRVRVVNPIQTETKGIRPIKYEGGNDLSYYTYLKDCRYQVQAHFIWNENRSELAGDRNENKHHNIARRCIEKGGRRDIFLGTRECQAYVEPCVFGEGVGFYDAILELSFGLMYHGMTYPDEAYADKVPETEGKLSKRFAPIVMKSGVIEYPAPWECPLHKPVHEMDIKPFGADMGNFNEISEKEVE